MLRLVTTVRNHLWAAVILLMATSAIICFAIGLIERAYVISAISLISGTSLLINWGYLTGRIGQPDSTSLTEGEEETRENANLTLATMVLINENSEQAKEILDLQNRLELIESK